MTSFSNACGLNDPLQLVIEGPGVKGAELRRFLQPFAVIGRDPRVDLLLDDPQVSRRHVYLQAVGGWMFWTDLESRTGTRTEAGPRKSGWLAAGESLGIGPSRIRWAAADPPGDDARARREPPRDTPLAAHALDHEPLPEVALEFLNGPSQSMFWPMNRVMSLIGSGKGCKFRLTDPSVALFHASLLRTPAGLWIVDLRGGGSVRVNAVPLRSSPLVDGDVVTIGRYRIRVRCRLRGAGARNGPPEAGRAAWPGPRALENRPAAVHQLALPERAAGRRAAAAPPRAIFAAATGVEVVSSETVYPARLNPPELSEAVLAPLVNQFSLMQQQMFDQFQQAMGMLVQMFGTMHREQMDVIREELDRLHHLSRELQELKAELASRRGSAETSTSTPGELAGAAAALDPVPAAEPGVRVAPAAVAAGPWGAPGTPPVEIAAAVPPVSTVAPVPPSSSVVVPPLFPTAGTPGPRQPLGAGPASPAPAPSPSPSRPTAAPRPEPARSGTGSPNGAGGRDSAPSDRDAVLWIHQRIAVLQRERESRWQKILKLIPGVS
jgi:pSer/pThr/pTyr-binding forkhead associated (FHA) protein